jgi:hypothetical protein
VRFLLEHGADANATRAVTESAGRGYISEKYSHLITPLIAAIRSNQIEMVRLLLERGAQVNTDEGINVPIVEAARFGNLEIVRLLLNQKGINLNATQSIDEFKDDDYYQTCYYNNNDEEEDTRMTALKWIEARIRDAQMHCYSPHQITVQIGELLRARNTTHVV